MEVVFSNWKTNTKCGHMLFIRETSKTQCHWKIVSKGIEKNQNSDPYNLYASNNITQIYMAKKYTNTTPSRTR